MTDSDQSQRNMIVKLTPLTPKDIAKHTGKSPRRKTNFNKSVKLDYEPATPKASIELAIELKKAINERNILTSKTRKRVFDCLDDMKSSTEEQSRNVKREKVLLEIVNSEIKYINQLECIINYFIKPVEEKKLLKTDDFNILFGNISTIYNINKELLEELDKGFQNVSNAFSKIAPFLKLYSVYAYEFKRSVKILQSAQSCNPNFAKFVQTQETRPEVQSKLSALLITPIQRVPRYKLLLKQLCALTTTKDTDYVLLQDCMEKVGEAANHINKVLENQENAQRLLELQRYLRGGGPNLIVPGRKLIKEGILHRMSSKKNGHNEKMYAVLMNDIIMLNKFKKDSLTVGSLKPNYIFPLNKCKVTEILDKGCLRVNCQEDELVLYHDQLSEMVSWISCIQETIDAYLEDRKSLRKESSNRRAVKRKNVNEYHEVGVSPGQPLKKKKLVPEEATPMARRLNIAARRSIHQACSSTPIKLESNPETNFSTNRSTFRSMDTTDFSAASGSHWKSEPTTDLGSATLVTNNSVFTSTDVEEKSDVFVFGQKPDEHNASKISTFFKSIGGSVKSFLGFKNSK